MPVIDSQKKEIHFKIVYYGPARSGKTTSINELQKQVSASKKSKVKKETSNERTIFFDFLALSSDTIGKYKTRFQIYTVPGQILYEDSRRVLLNGVDGVIFVADSQLDRLEENLQSLEELRGHLAKQGLEPGEVPMVLQYNKRDLPGAPTIEELQKAINLYHIPDFETVATEGSGVLEAFKACTRQAILNLKNV